MRLRSMFVVVAVLSAACVPGNSPIRVTNFFPLDESCMFDDTISRTIGELDIAGPGQYRIDVRVVSDLEKNVVDVDPNGTPLNTASVNNFTEEEIDFSYTSKNPIINFAAEKTPIVGTIAPSATQDLISDLITDAALQKLRDNVNDPTQKTQLFVTLSLKGHLESGETIGSNAATFPITVINSNPGLMCPTGFVPTGPCAKVSAGFPGVDGAGVQCNP